MPPELILCAATCKFIFGCSRFKNGGGNSQMQLPVAPGRTESHSLVTSGIYGLLGWDLRSSFELVFFVKGPFVSTAIKCAFLCCICFIIRVLVCCLVGGRLICWGLWLGSSSQLPLFLNKACVACTSFALLCSVYTMYSHVLLWHHQHMREQMWALPSSIVVWDHE